MLRQTFAEIKSKYILSLLLGSLVINASFAQSWQSLAPGINYLELPSVYTTPWSHIHVFKIDLQYNQLDLLTAHDMQQRNAAIQQFAHHGHALIAINGGFFDQTYQPLGLRIGHAYHYSALKPISWWGVFSISQQHASMTSSKDFQASSHTDFAVQSGPRLVINHQIPKLKPGRAERSALGINAEGQVIIVVTENTPLSTTELARLMQSPPLSCQQALNLDGGSSTQLFAEINGFKINTHRFYPVSDAILVKPLKKHTH